MAIHTADTSCCGLTEIANISDALGPRAVLRYVRTSWHSPLYFFTGVVRYEEKEDIFIPKGWLSANYGEELADLIRELGLGSLTRSKTTLNDGSGNWIRVWTWRPDWDALRKANLEEPWKKDHSSSTSKAASTRRRSTTPSPSRRVKRVGSRRR